MQDYMLKISALSYRTAMIIAGIVTAFWYFSMFNDGSSIDASIQASATQLTAEQAKSKESDEALKAVEDIQTAVATLTEQFNLASKQLPTDIPMADILRSVDALAKSTGINLKTKEPKQKQSKKEDIVEMVPLRIVAEGTFSELTMFIYYLSSMERITRAVNFSFAVANANDFGRPGSNPYNGKLTWDGEIINYRFIGEQKVADDKGIKKK